MCAWPGGAGRRADALNRKQPMPGSPQSQMTTFNLQTRRSPRIGATEET
jgi:hypothetical protein